MNRTKIEWCDYTWNPIKGLCPENCKLPDGKSYCYARRMYQRFGWPKGLSLLSGLVGKYGRPPAGSRIFVCSTMEMFHPDIPGGWRDWIFEEIEEYPELTFIILTKRPERIDRAMPDNVWLGVSVTGFEDYAKKIFLMKQRAKVRFISYEPMLTAVPPELFHGLDWAILGRLTGRGKKHDPSPMSLAIYKSHICGMGIPLFIKNNLKGIRPGPLIQKFPKPAKEKTGVVL